MLFPVQLVDLFKEGTLMICLLTAVLVFLVLVFGVSKPILLIPAAIISLLMTAAVDVLVSVAITIPTAIVVIVFSRAWIMEPRAGIVACSTTVHLNTATAKANHTAWLLSTHDCFRTGSGHTAAVVSVDSDRVTCLERIPGLLTAEVTNRLATLTTDDMRECMYVLVPTRLPLTKALEAVSEIHSEL